MARYVVTQNADDLANAVLVRDGFSLPALIFPFFWLAFYRQWLATMAVIGVMVLGALAAWQLNAPLLAVAADLPISIYVALEGATLRIANLERAGWHEAAVVEADNLGEAEIRYYGDLPQTNIARQASDVPLLQASTTSFGRPNAFAFPARN